MTLTEKKYGEWALVAGGAVGMGGAYCDRLAQDGMNVVVCDRDAAELETKCAQLERDFGIRTVPVLVDLGATDALETVREKTDHLAIDVLVYNAGLASMALFTDRDIDYEMYRLNVNVRSLLALSLWFTRGMKDRGRGALILMSSVGGAIGTPYVQTYSATKAYALTLAEALWGELREYGIDVLGVLPGNTIGQNFSDVPPGTPGFQTGREVVDEAFVALGTDPTVIAGGHNRESIASTFDIGARKATIMVMKDRMRSILDQYGAGTDS
ncbi:SDR family NAD(P)-dependent oxidoreductase [Jongsikchunia kroppenstedtii]|uniref:SDR family NAD(P)-dependent oxidoreductase n=1 Tax=Jongsikchunia kroppenstedtii TaxID=1121721 RepID=UPI00038004C5|nr:SDR family NAD(P)-dependent oxidoreductase [Jongsikchunia kroppenstedtii]